MNIRYKNILLINPWEGEFFPPPSIGYLQSAIKDYFKDTVNVTSLDLGNAVNAIMTFDYDLIGISFHSFSVAKARYLHDIIRSHQHCFLICGGHHPSSIPSQLIGIGYDLVIKGEGEDAIIDVILGRIDDNTNVYSKKNVYFKSVDDYPFPDYTGLTGLWQTASRETMGYPIISSRGCPFTCNFCASQMFWDRRWIMRSPRNVVDELHYRIINNQMLSWMFEDDNFTLNKRRAIDICTLIKEEIIPVYGILKWQCASRADVLNDDELCNALVSAGCQKVWLGIESLSQRSLDRCKKNINAERVMSGIDNAVRHGLETMSQFIVGLPGDTMEDILITAENIKKSTTTDVGVNIAWILPGTEIHRQALSHGFDNNTFISSGVQYYNYEQSIDNLNLWSKILRQAK